MYLDESLVKFYICLVVDPALEALENSIPVIAAHREDKGKAKLFACIARSGA